MRTVTGKKNEQMLIERVCSYGNKVIGYKYIINNRFIDFNNKPKVPDYIPFKQSHGICKDCIVNVYNQNGLLPDYKTIMKYK